MPETPTEAIVPYRFETLPLSPTRTGYLITQEARALQPVEIIAFYTLVPEIKDLDALIKELRPVYIYAPLVFALVLTTHGIAYAPCAVDPKAEWDNTNVSLFEEYHQLVFLSETAAQAWLQNRTG